jgi:hypothetical protein
MDRLRSTRRVRQLKAFSSSFNEKESGPPRAAGRRRREGRNNATPSRAQTASGASAAPTQGSEARRHLS